MNTKRTWALSPELEKRVHEFFDGNLSETSRFPVSFYPSEGISTYTSEGKRNVEMEVPGISKEDLEVNYNDYDGYLTVHGKATTHGKERTVKKTIFLGEGLDDKLMTATLEDGILVVSFPEAEKTKKPTGNKITIR